MSTVGGHVALATRALSKKFGSLVVADDISFEVPMGARYAIIGPNGAGKTTLINLIAGSIDPDAGAVLFGGSDITALAPDERVRRGLARTFQITSLFPRLAPLEAVALAVCERRGLASRAWRGVATYRDAIAEAHQILKSVGLASDCTRETRTLAYGRQRLLEIALALATRPKVLLLDEPAAGVGQGQREAVFAALAALPPDVAVLFIEHDMSFVFRFATSVVVLVAGRILTEGAPAEIAADPAVREVYLGSRRYG